MTYREYIEQTLKPFDVSAEDVALILVNQAASIPDPEADVNPAIAQRAICNEIASFLPLANVTEGGFAMAWNLEAIKLWYEATCAKIGMEPRTKPRIKTRRSLW